MDFDNSFDNIIEYDGGSSSDKENEDMIRMKQPKTTDEQFRKIATFMSGANALIFLSQFCM